MILRYEHTLLMWLKTPRAICCSEIYPKFRGAACSHDHMNLSGMNNKTECQVPFSFAVAFLSLSLLKDNQEWMQGKVGQHSREFAGSAWFVLALIIQRSLSLAVKSVGSNGEGTGVLPCLPKRLPCQLSLKLTLFDVICKADKGATDQSLNAVKVLSFELRISAQYYAKSTQAPYNLCDIAFAAMTSTRVGQMHLT